MLFFHLPRGRYLQCEIEDGSRRIFVFAYSENMIKQSSYVHLRFGEYHDVARLSQKKFQCNVNCQYEHAYIRKHQPNDCGYFSPFRYKYCTWNKVWRTHQGLSITRGGQ